MTNASITFLLLYLHNAAKGAFIAWLAKFYHKFWETAKADQLLCRQQSCAPQLNQENEGEKTGNLSIPGLFGGDKRDRSTDRLDILPLG